ncbi:MAG: SDR family oxidoreductase [Candidatus Thorarchaeota archaeon]
MKTVITGSTSGIGLSLSKKFLELGDDVVISSRNITKVNEIVTELLKEFPERQIYGITCDVTKYSDIANLADKSKEIFGRIDYWINNAGTTGFEHKPLTETSDDVIDLVIKTNLYGTLIGCKEALRVMLPQKNGSIFNMAGLGSNGRLAPNLLTYATTKSAIPYLTKTLAKENENSGIGIHLLSPGMVLTDLLLKDSSTKERRIFNILAEEPRTVANFLVPRMKRITGNGKEIVYLTNKKAIMKFITSFRRKNRFFDSNGNLHKKILI